jgi:hypothetical protein
MLIHTNLKIDVGNSDNVAVAERHIDVRLQRMLVEPRAI